MKKLIAATALIATSLVAYSTPTQAATGMTCWAEYSTNGFELIGAYDHCSGTNANNWKSHRVKFYCETDNGVTPYKNYVKYGNWTQVQYGSSGRCPGLEHAHGPLTVSYTTQIL